MVEQAQCPGVFLENTQLNSVCPCSLSVYMYSGRSGRGGAGPTGEMSAVIIPMVPEAVSFTKINSEWITDLNAMHKTPRR